MGNDQYKVANALEEWANKMAEAAFNALIDWDEDIWELQAKWPTAQRNDAETRMTEAVIKAFLGVK